jgi:hypothetical protein
VRGVLAAPHRLGALAPLVVLGPIAAICRRVHRRQVRPLDIIGGRALGHLRAGVRIARDFQDDMARIE